MMKVDDAFFDRADEHINLSNKQVSGNINPGKVSASMMYATSRYNAYVSAIGFNSQEEMESKKMELIEYFMEQFRIMLEENLEDYISNFPSYMKKD